MDKRLAAGVLALLGLSATFGSLQRRTSLDHRFRGRDGGGDSRPAGVPRGRRRIWRECGGRRRRRVRGP